MKDPAQNSSPKQARSGRFSRSAKSMLLYATPWPAISRTAHSLGSMGRSLRDAARGWGKAAGDLRPDRKGTQPAPSPGETGRQRFARAIEEGGWSREDLKLQAGRIRAAKFSFVGLFLALLVFVPVLVLISPWLLIIFIAPGGAALLTVCGFMALKHAWWECQIEQADYMSFRQFIGRRDLWVRVLS